MISVTEYTLLTPAISPALDLGEVKDYLKISDNDSDSKIINLISAVTDYAEKATGRDLINKTYKGYLNCFPLEAFSYPYCPSIEIRKSKLQSITSIQYYLDGVLTTWASTDYYLTDSSSYATINLVDGKSYPATDTRKQAVVVTFVAGYGDDECDIPSGLKQAMLSQIAALYDNAGDCSEQDGGMSQFKGMYRAYTLAQKLVLII